MILYKSELSHYGSNSLFFISICQTFHDTILAASRAKPLTASETVPKGICIINYTTIVVIVAFVRCSYNQILFVSTARSEAKWKRLQSWITSSHIEEAWSCFGIRRTGSRFVRLATTASQDVKARDRGCLRFLSFFCIYSSNS